ncbi:molybdopterin-dependent oxidoreductase [Marivibrio halodurans]|uniref:Molybdopterin-dependent oxidoreductase n=1 Tax=Marivibrio halodurans TaxID=2039722 RepID=A0A8J7S2A2_9PROT|nr:molybdopterin-dependent oxidoreductase [Marivibrio halodurans]MBP5859037.1 molybdopterin-dependent oxidoreductase [Marivibrio halodurans]
MTAFFKFRKLLALAVLICATASLSLARAESAALDAPKGPVVLSVEGRIANTNRAGGADFDMEQLQALPWVTRETYTDWTDGAQTFEGVPLQALLDAVGARGDRITAVALNDYKVGLPASDAKEHDVLLAIKHEGKFMRVRDKGPIWIIYPRDEASSTLPDRHNEKMVWQLRTLVIE